MTATIIDFANARLKRRMRPATYQDAEIARAWSRQLGIDFSAADVVAVETADRHPATASPVVTRKAASD